MPQDLTGEGEGAGAGPVLPTQLALGVCAAAGPDSVFTGGWPYPSTSHSPLQPGQPLLLLSAPTG